MEQPEVREVKVNIGSEFVLNLVTFLTREENFVFVGNESEIWLENLSHPRVQLIYINDQQMFTAERATYISQKAQIIASKIKRKFLMRKVDFLVLNTCVLDELAIEENQAHVLVINLRDANEVVASPSLRELFPEIAHANLTADIETIIAQLQAETKVRANQEVAFASLRTKPIATYGFLALNIIFFAFLWWRSRDLPSWFIIISYGSTYSPLIVAGEVWRLLTAAFMHVDLWHIVFNAMFIYRFGQMLEVVMGPVRMVAIMLVSAVMGSLFGFAFSPSFSIGASGVAYGLVGAMLFLAFEMRKAFMPFMQQFFIQFIGLAVITSFVIPNIDHWGHIGGFVGGFIAAAIVGVKGVKPFWARTVLTTATLAILAAGLWTGGVRLTENHDYREINRALVINNFYLGNENRALRLMEHFGIDFSELFNR